MPGTARVVLVDATGAYHEIDASIGTSLMSCALRNGVPGIIAECGGALACASCHVYVDPEWFEATGGVKSGEEDEMLEEVLDERLPNSRLSCQIDVTAELDGLLVRIPTIQA